MTQNRGPDPGFDQRITDWFEADPDRAPGHLLGTVLDAVPTMRPQRTIHLPGRSPAMPRSIYLALGLATAVIAATVVAVGGLVGRPTIAEPSGVAATAVLPSPQSSPSPTTRPARNGLIAVIKDADLVLVDPTNGDVVKVLVDNPPDIPTQDIADLSWAPDGRRLAYAGNGGAWIINMADYTSRLLVSCGRDEGACSIAWSPDGERIAVAMRGKLELVDPDGAVRTTVLEGQAGLTQPTWSPDGARIAFVAEDNQAERTLFVVDRDGSGLSQLVEAPGGLGTWDPAWSPDGSTIAYIGSTDHRTCLGTSTTTGCQDDWRLHVMVVELDGSEPRELLPAGICFCLGFAPGATWAPDGTALAVVIPGEGADGVFDGLVVVKADGTGQRQVGDGAWGTPAWQPVP